MRRIISVLTLLVVLISFAIVSSASVGAPRLVDDAGLLTSSESERLLAKLDEISTRQGMDVVVVTVNSTDGKSAMEYADDYYDYNGYSDNGVLLLLDMGGRNWWISTKGTGIGAFTDYGIEYIGEKISSDLSNGYYADAFTDYANLCDDFINQYKAGTPFDTPPEPFHWFGWGIAAIIGGLIFGAIKKGKLVGQLKSVQHQTNASNYVRAGSLGLTNSSDVFLYNQITRTPRPSSSSSRGGGGSSTHTSSSGSTHGGGGGRF